VQDFINFRVERLSFLLCGVDLQVYRGAFFLSNGSGLNINHVAVLNSSGFGLAAFSLQDYASINNSVFSGNRATDTYRGGNVMIMSSDLNSGCLFGFYNSQVVYYSSRCLWLQTKKTFNRVFQIMTSS
jgi:hypothetical protein